MATKQIFLGVSDSIASGVGNLSSLPVQFLLNDENQSFRRSIEVPLGYTAISAITLRYVRRSTGNLYLRFVSGHTPKTTSSTLTEDSTAFTTYVVSGTAGQIANITVPTGTYNALTSMVVGDLFSIGVQRDASNALDTYEDDLEVVGFLVEFTTATVSGGAVAAATNAILSLDVVKDYLSISLLTATDDDFLQLAINNQSSWIESQIINKVKSQLITGEISDGTGRCRLRTKYFPIISLTLLQYLDENGTWTDILTTLTDAILRNPENQFSNQNNSFYIELPTGYYFEPFIYTSDVNEIQNIKVSYYAGYAVIPTEIYDVCLERVVDYYKRSSRGGGRFGKESDAGSGMAVSTSTRYIDFSPRHKEMLQPFKRRYE